MLDLDECEMESAVRRAMPSTPPGTRIYVVGGVYGRSDLLDRAVHFLHQDVRDANAQNLTAVAVFLGGYIDHGPDAQGVIQKLVELEKSGLCTFQFLRGSHEQLLLDLIEGREATCRWLEFGGLETLASYDARLPPGPRDVRQLRDLLNGVLPPAHLAFLRDTKLFTTAGDYIFAHAGARADRPLEAQSATDLLWRRYSEDAPSIPGRMVIHGHLPVANPLVRAGRIGIETNARSTGVLTLLKLEADRRDFVRITAGQDRTRRSLPAIIPRAPDLTIDRGPLARTPVTPKAPKTRPSWPIGRNRIAAVGGVLGCAALALVLISIFGSAGQLRAQGESSLAVRGAPSTAGTADQGLRPSEPAAAPTRMAQQAPAPAPKPVPEKAAASPAHPLVQVAATDSEALGRRLWSEISTKFPDDAKGKTLTLQPVQVRGHTLYRVLVSGFSTATETTKFCRSLRASGYGCMERR